MTISDCKGASYDQTGYVDSIGRGPIWSFLEMEILRKMDKMVEK